MKKQVAEARYGTFLYILRLELRKRCSNLKHAIYYFASSKILSLSLKNLSRVQAADARYGTFLYILRLELRKRSHANRWLMVIYLYHFEF
jgi:hypothetical protein